MNQKLNQMIEFTGNEYIQVGNKYYVNCPDCHAKAKDKKAFVNMHGGRERFKCFRQTCQASYGFYQLKERVNGYSPKPSLNLTPKKNNPPELTIRDTLLIPKIFKTALELLPQTDYHLAKFKHKRKLSLIHISEPTRPY